MREGLSVEEAREAVLAATPVLGAETVSTDASQGRILAEDVSSTRTLPPADCSAMDGYAVRRADLAGASKDSPVVFPVVFEVAAGSQPLAPVGPGQAVRISTGAPVPVAP